MKSTLYYSLLIVMMHAMYSGQAQAPLEQSINTSGQFVMNDYAQMSWSLGELIVLQSGALSPILHSGSLTVLSSEDIDIDFSRVYPNPTKDHISIKITATHPEIRINLLSLEGKVLKSSQMSSFQNETTIDLSNYPDGLYLLDVINYQDQTLDHYKIVKNQLP